jgi:hypothetical protein
MMELKGKAHPRRVTAIAFGALAIGRWLRSRGRWNITPAQIRPPNGSNLRRGWSMLAATGFAGAIGDRRIYLLQAAIAAAG